jgi:hypothetical protein
MPDPEVVKLIARSLNLNPDRREDYIAAELISFAMDEDGRHRYLAKWMARVEDLLLRLEVRQ